jgi:hypothetical protein
MATASLPPPHEALTYFTRWRNRRHRVRRAIASFFESIRGWFAQKILNWRIAHTVRDPNMPCPACGARSGKIRWVATIDRRAGKTGALVHQCAVCTASWAEAPIIAAEAWRIAVTPAEQKAFEEVLKRG